MTYAEKLKNPKWQKKRLEVLDRDNYSCTVCGDTETELHVHHKKYKNGKAPWEYELDNFSTLCKYCHDFVTNYTKNNPEDDVIQYTKHNSSDGRLLYFVLAYSEKESKYLLVSYEYSNTDGIWCFSCFEESFLNDVMRIIKDHKNTTNGNV
jgi:hypothetical protein